MSGYRVESGRKLRNSWNEIITSSGFQPQEHIVNRAAPALKWLQEQDELERQRQDHKSALDTLAQAAGHGQSVRQLQELHNHAAKLGAVPDTLEERYQSRLALLQRKTRRRQRFIYSGLVIGVIAAAIIIGISISHQLYEDRVTTAVTVLTNMIERGQFKQAEELVQELSKNVQQDPRVKEITAKLPDAINKANSQQVEFSQLFKTVELDLNQIQKSLANEPGQPTLGRLWGGSRPC